MCLLYVCFFFKQKTAYEMRISDWSSDVCSSDLLDATCPLVSKVHREAERHERTGRQILLIGHAGHPEVIGTMGQVPAGAILLVENTEAAEKVAVEDRSEERRVGKECVSTCRSRWSPYH